MEKEIFKKILLTEENIDYLKDEKIESWNIKKLLGINLTQSQSIKFGFVFQTIVKELIISAGGVIIDKRFIDIYNTGNSGKKNKGLKDVDILFSMNNIIYYFEMKTNLNLDSEKSKSTDIKVADITNWVVDNYPDNIVNSNTPRAQISAGGPQYSVLRTISGAIYEGVPQNILIFYSLGMQVENPKSISFT